MHNELREFENKRIFGLKKSQDKIFINTGRKGIFLSIYPGKPYISIGKVKGQRMLPSVLSGLKIEKVHQIDFDRILEVILKGNIIIYIEITGTSGNIIVEENKKIIWTFKQIKGRNLLIGKKYHPPEPFQGINPLKIAGVGEKIISGERVQGLSKKFIKFISQSSSDAINNLFNEMSNGKFFPTVYIKEQIPVGIAPYPLPLKYRQISFPRMSEAVNFYYSEIIAFEEEERHKNQIISQIEKRIENIEKRIEKLLNKKQDFNEYKIKGNAILFNQNIINKGQYEIVISNPYNYQMLARQNRPECRHH